jgi:hypothetical protein
MASCGWPGKGFDGVSDDEWGLQRAVSFEGDEVVGGRQSRRMRVG